MRNFASFSLIVGALLAVGCHRAPKPDQDAAPAPSVVEVLADTITYDVFLTPQDTTNPWQVECLRHLDRKRLVDHIFEQLYNGQLVAHDYLTGEPLSPKQVRELEQQDGFNRKLVNKAQFRELWGLDSTGHLQKRILDITFGLEMRSDQGTLLGHRGLFRVKN